MSRPCARPTRGEAGQAAVELVALLPLLAVLAGVLWQAVVAGQAVWLAGSAARAAARATAIGGDGRSAARRALPGHLEPGLRVDADDDGGVRVRVRIPLIVGGSTLGSASARARLQSQAP